MAIITKYKWAGGEIWAHQFNTGTGTWGKQIDYPRRGVPVATYTGSAENPTDIKFNVVPNGQLMADLELPPGYTFQTALGGDQWFRYMGGDQVVPVSGKNASYEGQVFAPPLEPTVGEGLVRTYTFENGKIIRRDQSQATGRIVDEAVLGRQRADGKIEFYRAVSPNAMTNLGLPPGVEFYLNGNLAKYTDAGLDYVTTPGGTGGTGGTGETGGTDGTGGTGGTGGTDGTGGTGGTGWTGGNFSWDDFWKQFGQHFNLPPGGSYNLPGGIPGYDPSIIKSSPGNYVPTPVGQQVTQNDLNRYFLDSWRQSKDANEKRFAAAYTGAAQVYANTMADLAGLGAQEAKDISQSYANAAQAGHQDLVRRGVTGSTIAPTMRLGYQRESTDALSRLSERLRRERIGYQNQAAGTIFNLLQSRSDPYPDLVNYLMMKQGA